MSIEKVSLPREVAEAIEESRQSGYNNRMIIHAANGDIVGPYTLELARYTERSGNFETLLSALVNGYIIEKSPEEKLRNIYEEYEMNYKCTEDWERDNAYAEGVLFGIEEALAILGLTIEGIND